MLSKVFATFFDVLKNNSELDDRDWEYALRFANRWKLSVCDALLDLNFVDEQTMAKVLAMANNLPYISGTDLQCDFAGLELDIFDDLIRVGALPLLDNKLAIFNPYDDLRGHLGLSLCQRDMVVTERSYLFRMLRNQSLIKWLPEEEITED